jgi:hypothetical protein
VFGEICNNLVVVDVYHEMIKMKSMSSEYCETFGLCYGRFLKCHNVHELGFL